MIVEQIYATNKPRQNVWCKSSELQASETSGAYEFVDAAAAAKLGDGARIIVIDWPLTMLFWDKTAGVAYNWSDAESGGKLTTLVATANDTYTPPSGYDGFSSVEVDIQPALESLEATANDTYTPGDGYDGFSEVVVNVPNPNSRETAGGTVAAPWGTVVPAGLYAALSTGAASATLTIGANQTLGTPEVQLIAMAQGASTIAFSSINGLDATLADCNVADLAYDSTDGSLTKAMMLTGGAISDMTAAATLLETYLVVIWHPMS